MQSYKQYYKQRTKTMPLNALCLYSYEAPLLWGQNQKPGDLSAEQDQVHPGAITC